MNYLIVLFCLSCNLLAAFSLHTTSKESADKLEVIEALLDIQKSWQVNIRAQEPEEKLQDGFLFVKMTTEELLHLIDEKGVEILWIEDDHGLAAYLILTDISEFFDLYKNSEIRTFRFDGDELELVNLRYIEQIAVRRDACKQGFASHLLDEAKRVSPNGLIAAVLSEPFRNKASSSLFLKNGFHTIGFLDCIEGPVWPKYQTTVFRFNHENQ